MSNAQLAGKISLVTGCTRGLGKGIALQLAEKGSTVYITGRTLAPTSGKTGSLQETAEEIEKRGGKCIPVQCDHSKDEEVVKLFERIRQEQDGQLDILVNNAYSVADPVLRGQIDKFWKNPIQKWDSFTAVGARNSFICAGLAAEMMTSKRQGLIVNMSSMGGLSYVFCAMYGVGKACSDRMAADCAKELKDHNVAFVSLWPGGVLTETVQSIVQDNVTLGGEETGVDVDVQMESVEYAGMCITALATDPNVMEKSGKCLMTHDLGQEYGLKDKEGFIPHDQRSFMFLKGVLGVDLSGSSSDGDGRASDEQLMSIANKF